MICEESKFIKTLRTVYLNFPLPFYQTFWAQSKENCYRSLARLNSKNTAAPSTHYTWLRM